jgi:NAD(P)H dehydrogenase (quinone)
MFTVLGITGNVGGSTALALTRAGKKVRGVVRDTAKAAKLAKHGIELVTGDVNDVQSLVAAFRDCEGAFVMNPPNFAPQPGYPETKAVLLNIWKALAEAKPPKVAYLSSIGAQHDRGLGLITQSYMLEEQMKTLPVANAFIRGAWFLENYQWDVQSTSEKGVIDAYLDPISKPFPMVSTQDIGELAAKTLLENWKGNKVLEVEAAKRYSALDAARAFSEVLGREVKVNAVPRKDWQNKFVAQGMSVDTTAPRIEMIEGFNSGWIEFERKDGDSVKGHVTIEEVVRKLVEIQKK